jgi:hypothetical protein
VASIVARKSLAIRPLKVIQDDLRVTGTLRGILEGQNNLYKGAESKFYIPDCN